MLKQSRLKVHLEEDKQIVCHLDNTENKFVLDQGYNALPF